jgi:hypothetical protein
MGSVQHQMDLQHVSAYLPECQAAGPCQRNSHPVPTACAAFWLNLSPQTLRAWTCFENGPIRSVRIQGRLAWSVESIVRVLKGRAA